MLGLSLLDSFEKDVAESSQSLPEADHLEGVMREASRNVELFENLSHHTSSGSDLQVEETEAVRISRQLQEVIKTSSGSDVDQVGADVDSLDGDEDDTAIAIDIVPAQQKTREIDADSLQDSEQLSIGNLDSDSLQDQDSVMQISAESFEMDPSSSSGPRDPLMQQSGDSMALMERSVDSLEMDPTPKAVDFQIMQDQSPSGIMERSIDSLEQDAESRDLLVPMDLEPQLLPPPIGVQQQDLSDSGSFSLSQSSSMMQSMTGSYMMVQSMQSSGCRDMMTISQDSIEEEQQSAKVTQTQTNTGVIEAMELDREGNVSQVWGEQPVGDDTTNITSPDTTSAMSFTSSRELSLVSDPVSMSGMSLETDPVSPSSSVSSSHSDNCYCNKEDKLSVTPMATQIVADSRGTFVCLFVHLFVCVSVWWLVKPSDMLGDVSFSYFL